MAETLAQYFVDFLQNKITQRIDCIHRVAIPHS